MECTRDTHESNANELKWVNWNKNVFCRLSRQILLSLRFSLLKSLSRAPNRSLSRPPAGCKILHQRHFQQNIVVCIYRYIERVYIYIYSAPREWEGVAVHQVWSQYCRLSLRESKASAWLKFVCESSTMGGTSWAKRINCQRHCVAPQQLYVCLVTNQSQLVA